jgi:hypothetical protein
MNKSNKDCEFSQSDFSSDSHSINVNIAKVTKSTAAASVFNYILLCIKAYAAKGHNYRDGRTWMCESLPSIAENFSYLSTKQVRTGIDRLLAHGYIIKNKYNKENLDQTNWYALANEKWLIESKRNPSKGSGGNAGTTNWNCRSAPRSAQGNIENPKKADGYSRDKVYGFAAYYRPSIRFRPSALTVCSAPYLDIYTNTKESIYNIHIAQNDPQPQSSNQIQSPHTTSTSSSSIRAKDPDIIFCWNERKFKNISSRDLEDWKKLYPCLNVERELCAMEQWVLAHPTKSKKKLWRKFILGWLSRGNDKAYNQQAYAHARRDSQREQVLARHSGLRKDDSPVHPSKVFDFSKDEVNIPWELKDFTGDNKPS